MNKASGLAQALLGAQHTAQDANDPQFVYKNTYGNFIWSNVWPFEQHISEMGGESRANSFQ